MERCVVVCWQDGTSPGQKPKIPHRLVALWSRRHGRHDRTLTSDGCQAATQPHLLRQDVQFSSQAHSARRFVTTARPEKRKSRHCSTTSESRRWGGEGNPRTGTK